MAKIIYYVASSLDGFICGANEDISSFVAQGNGVEKYLADLKKFKTVIMGRKTYEFGYKYGLKPGQPAYENMEHYIFSDTMKLDHKAENVHIKSVTIDNIASIKNSSETDIYLCGGGEFAGWLLENKLIDQLKLKLNPIIIAEGTKLFGNYNSSAKLKLISSESYDEGLQILTYDFEYSE